MTTLHIFLLNVPRSFLFSLLGDKQNHPICYLQLETLHTGEIVAPDVGGLKDRSQHRKHDWARKGTEAARRWGLRTSNDRLGTSWDTGNSLLLPLVSATHASPGWPEVPVIREWWGSGDMGTGKPRANWNKMATPSNPPSEVPIKG